MLCRRGPLSYNGPALVDRPVLSAARQARLVMSSVRIVVANGFARRGTSTQVSAGVKVAETIRGILRTVAMIS